MKSSQNTPAPATEGAQREAVALAPIESNEFYKDRFYIPLPGGWEIQTKGSGSSFRICNTKDGERINVSPQPYLYETLEQMAREIHAACSAPPPPDREPERVEAHTRTVIAETGERGCSYCGGQAGGGSVWPKCPACGKAPPTDASGGVTEDALWKLLGGTCYLDPPDGGDVPLIEQLRRMSEDAAKWRSLEAADRARKPDTSAQAASAGEETMTNEELTNAITYASCRIRQLSETEAQHKLLTEQLERLLKIQAARAAPTDVAAYREVTLEDARRADAIYRKGPTKSCAGDMLAALNHIHAVIRITAGAGEKAQS